MLSTESTQSTGSGGWWVTPGAPAAPLPEAAALPRAFRRTPDLARDVVPNVKPVA